MLFSTIDYFVFLAIVLLGYWFWRRDAEIRHFVVFFASCAFYMAWDWRYIVLILGSTALDYGLGLGIHAAKDRARKKLLLGASLLGNLGLLAFFKYYNFGLAAGSDVLAYCGFAPADSLVSGMHNFALPVGISFYTFQTLSYTIDIYRGKIEPTRDFLKFACFVTYFPQLVAGPIVRASEFLPQLERNPTLTKDGVSEGLFLIGTGLTKKIVFADFISVNLVDRVFAAPHLYTATEVVIALYGFTLQIYCDFSGYTDCARGSAKLMGLSLPRNFERPYQAKNPADFWRRWHMTLSTWLRDYLYFPLGGSRAGPIRAYFNLFVTMFLIGIWHGASWTFVLYALIQSVAMVGHRFVHRKWGRGKDAVDSMAMTFVKVFACLQFVVFSRILFRATSFDNALEVTERLFSATTSIAQIPGTVAVLLVFGFVAHYLPKEMFERIKSSFIRLPAVVQGSVLCGLGIALAEVAAAGPVPYIYFQF